MSTTVFRVEKNREFVVMSNKFLREKGMSLKSKGLLALCLALPDDWEYSLNGLVAICKESQTSIRSALKELESFNYLKRNRQQNEKGQFVYEYVIYEQPYIENLYADNQHKDKRHKENRIQQNTKRQTIKKQNINNGFMDELKQLYEGADNGE
jgi:predicted transcriptional regulator